MKKLWLLFIVLVVISSGCDVDDIRKSPLSLLEQEIRANAGASISPAGSRTCADITHPNCVELTSCGDYSSYSDTYFLLMQDISDPMTCVFLGDGDVLDLNGHTITFANGYDMLPNWNFEIWTDGSPDNWDISGAPGARQAGIQEMPLVDDYSLYVPTAGSVIVSDWVYLPVGNRHYRGEILYQDGNGGMTIDVENSGGSVVCTETYGADFDGEGMTGFCDFDNQPAGNYRIRITTNSNNQYLDIGGILPAHDHGVGLIRYYSDDYCGTYTGTCYSPDYMHQSGTTGASIIVKDGYIISGSFLHSGYGITSYYMSGGTLDVENVIINVSGIDANAIRTTSGGSISYSELYNYQPWITTRQQLLRTNSVIGSQDFHHNIASGGQGVINVAKDDTRIYNNVIENDQSVTNHYAITYSADNSEVFNNVFDPIRGSGILVYRSNGISIYNNTFYSVAQPCDPEYITGSDLTFSTNAIRINDYSSDETFNVDVYNNDFHIVGEYYTNPEHPGCTPISTGIFFSASGPNNNIFDNRFYTEKRNDNDNLHLYALYMGDETTANIPQDNKLVYNNYFESNDKAVWITSFYGQSTDMWLENNTFNRVDNTYYTPSDYDAAIQMGSKSFDANNLRLINNKFLGGFDPDEYSFTGWGGSYDLTKKHYLHVYVEDSAGNKIENVLVTAISQNGGPAIGGTSDVNGYVNLYLSEYYESGDLTSGGNHNRVYYNPYDVIVNYEGVDYNYGQVNADSEEIITMVADSSCSPDGLTRPCGISEGQCSLGIQTCSAGIWGSCVGEVTPIVEICDGMDNDCDGFIDESLGETTCGEGICTNTVQNCVGGAPSVCNPLLGQQSETSLFNCGNSIDENCNGFDEQCVPEIISSPSDGAGGETTVEFTCDIEDPTGIQSISLVKETGGVEQILETEEFLSNKYYFLEAEEFNFSESEWDVCFGLESCENNNVFVENTASALGHAISEEGTDGSSNMTYNLFLDPGTYLIFARSDIGGSDRAWQVGIENYLSPIFGDGSGGFTWENGSNYVSTTSGIKNIQIIDAAVDVYWTYPDLVLITNDLSFDPVSSCGEDVVLGLVNNFPARYSTAQCGLTGTTSFKTFNVEGLQGDFNWACSYVNGVGEEIISEFKYYDTETSPTCTDFDGDTYSVEGGGCGLVDCNDNNATINPGASEICDLLDNDCDGSTVDGFDEIWFDNLTTCGVGECANSGNLECISGEQTDSCIVGDPSNETCNGLDDDCDGSADEDLNCGPSISQVINLSMGWNVVSLNLVNNSLTSEDLESTYVMRYNDGWETDWNGITGDEFPLEPLRGYYVYSGSNKSLTFSGIPSSSEYSLINNTWNLFSVNNTMDGNGFLVSVIDGGFSYDPVPTFMPGVEYWVEVGDVMSSPPLYEGLSFDTFTEWIKWLFSY